MQKFVISKQINIKINNNNKLIKINHWQLYVMGDGK